MSYVFRPTGVWTEGDTYPRRSRYAFKASWNSTLSLLKRELYYLDADHVVIQADFSEGDIRLDGMPRANARQPRHPGIRVAFESKHGPLTYATDACEFWQHNVRAIALGLEALRAVDRYGVTRRGEQYTGWKQLPTGTPMPAAMTVDEAARFVAEHGRPSLLDIGGRPDLTHPAYAGEMASAYRAAARKLHPDTGGDTAMFQRLQDAKRVLDEATSRP